MHLDFAALPVFCCSPRLVHFQTSRRRLREDCRNLQKNRESEQCHVLPAKAQQLDSTQRLTILVFGPERLGVRPVFLSHAAPLSALACCRQHDTRTSALRCTEASTTRSQ